MERTNLGRKKDVGKLLFPAGIAGKLEVPLQRCSHGHKSNPSPSHSCLSMHSGQGFPCQGRLAHSSWNYWWVHINIPYTPGSHLQIFHENILWANLMPSSKLSYFGFIWPEQNKILSDQVQDQIPKVWLFLRTVWILDPRKVTPKWGIQLRLAICNEMLSHHN